MCHGEGDLSSQCPGLLRSYKPAIQSQTRLDAASLQARMTAAQICEELLDELIQVFELDPEDPYPLPAGQEKTDVYIYRQEQIIRKNCGG